MVINHLNLLNLVMNLRVTSVFLCAPRARALGCACVRVTASGAPGGPSHGVRLRTSRFDRPAFQRPGELSKWKLKSALHIYSYSLLLLPSCLTVQRSYFTRKIATPEGGARGLPSVRTYMSLSLGADCKYF